MTQDFAGITKFELGNRTFRSFCNQTGDDLEVLQYLDCYELCEKCIVDNRLIRDNYKDICKTSPDPGLRRDLRRGVKERKPNEDIIEYLKEIQIICYNSITGNYKYIEFQSTMLNKLPE